MDLNNLANHPVRRSLFQDEISRGGLMQVTCDQGNPMEVCIRYNNMDTDGSLKWRILVDGVEYLACEISVNIPCRTSSIQIAGTGLRHHISCMATIITFRDGKAEIN